VPSRFRKERWQGEMRRLVARRDAFRRHKLYPRLIDRWVGTIEYDAVVSHRRNTGEEHQKSTDTRELKSTHRFARYLALPIVSAGIIGGAALGLAG
jgi:hypothetical protein